MARTERFNIGFLQLDPGEEMFLSVTPGFEHGPGIQRDGITSPRMSDPHDVPRIRNLHGLPAGARRFGATTDAYVQRAGTWTLYHHLKAFIESRGSEWTVVGVQSNGDLTMNPWHIAYIGRSHIVTQAGELCGLLTEGDPQEPVSSRIYRCIVKWSPDAAAARQALYDGLDLRVEETVRGRALRIADTAAAAAQEVWMKQLPEYDVRTKNIAPLVEFALSGKPVVEDGVELSLANAIDRFQDVRHVFNLPTVRATGFLKGQEVNRVNFGEFQLFGNLNERRAALSSPVVIDLNIDDRVLVDWAEAAAALRKRNFRESRESPTRRGEFRRYVDEADREKVEIFFPHNVYPFGVLGMQMVAEPQQRAGLVCLSSGGLSGRVGNTLEGIARIMFDFFGCSDAFVLDEGYDVFFVANPRNGNGDFKYANEQLLDKVLSFTKARFDKDHEESLRTSATLPYSAGLREFPLNQKLAKELDTGFAAVGQLDYADVLLVEPQRSQMRSVLIFAAKTEPGRR